MSASIRQFKVGAANSVTSAQLVLDAEVSVGSTVVVQVYLSQNSRTAALSDDSASGQTWTAIGTMPQDPAGSTDCRQYAWRCVADEAFDTLTATISGGSVSSVHLLAVEIEGVDGTPSVVAQETYTSTSDPIAATGIVTDAADQFLVACICKDSASEAWSASSGWTTEATTLRAQILTQDAASAGTYGCSINWASSTARDIAAVFAAFPVSDPVSSTPSFRYLSSFF